MKFQEKFRSTSGCAHSFAQAATLAVKPTLEGALSKDTLGHRVGSEDNRSRKMSRKKQETTSVRHSRMGLKPKILIFRATEESPCDSQNWCERSGSREEK